MKPRPPGTLRAELGTVLGHREPLPDVARVAANVARQEVAVA